MTIKFLTQINTLRKSIQSLSLQHARIITPMLYAHPTISGGSVRDESR